MTATSFTYLALGDSYTIGEGVETMDSFPFQLVRTLNEKVKRTAEYNPGLQPEHKPAFNKPLLFNDPVLIAKTGWTTSELLNAINKADLKDRYDIVTLLIGVNNQYRGLDLVEYGAEFGQLISIALGFTGNDPSRVFVISIPDWSATPFAADRDREAISSTIDRFNDLNQELSLKKGVHYIDITVGSREAINNPALVTKDQLHPSAIEYKKWSDKLVSVIWQQLSIKQLL